jgi:hypothetical protein
MFDDDDFDDEDYDPEEARRELEEERKRVDNLPITRKADELFEITKTIIDIVNEEDDELNYCSLMLEDVSIICAKIAGAEGGDLYTLRMENAVIIKVHARSLMTLAGALKYEKVCNPDYLDLLRNEIDEFRLIFIDWVQSFDKTNDIPDNWGLFYD